VYFTSRQSCYMCVCICLTEADVAAQSLPVRSVSDDQLLSHSEAFNIIPTDSSTSRLRCDSADFQRLTKSDDTEAEPQPTCKHGVPENCTSLCWTFTDNSDTGPSLMTDDDSIKTNSLPSVTQQLSMTKSKSSDHCCLLDDTTDQTVANQSTCFYPSSW